MKTQTLRNALFAISPEWREDPGRPPRRRLQPDRRRLERDRPCPRRPPRRRHMVGQALPSDSAGEALAKYSVDLTATARAGADRPRVGRDAEIREVIDILMRRRQNNPIIVGEAGVGKTALVEGFALRIAAGDVPPMLKDVRLLALDLAAMQAGASVKGEFENRLQAGDRGGAALAAAHRPLHRRGPHPDRRRRKRRHRGRRQPPEAGAGPRHAAHHRRHDLGRVQEALSRRTPRSTRRFQVVQVDEPERSRRVRMLRGGRLGAGARTTR